MSRQIHNRFSILTRNRKNVAYDLIIVNVCYPSKESIDMCREIHLRSIGTPVLIIANKSSVKDRVNWLNAGANSIFIYPFASEEIRARINALSHRKGFPKTAALKTGNIAINTETMEVYKGRNRIGLNKKEYLILEYLMCNSNSVITRTMIQDHVWGIDYDSESNLVDVYIRRLRGKLDESGQSSLIHTIRGVGYILKI